MDRALLHIGGQQEKADGFVTFSPTNDYPLVFTRDSQELMYILESIRERGLIELPPTTSGSLQYRLTSEGWGTVGQLKDRQPSSDQAFVALWFTEELGPAWKLGFHPALESSGFAPMRIDLVQHNNRIDDVIIAEIRRSGLLVADFTGNRRGVYFEAGFALGLGIPVIWTCRETDIEEVHFDTRQYNHILWSNPEDLREKLRNRIAATIPGRANRR